MQQGTRLPQGRRHFLRNLLALAGVGIFGLTLFELGSFLSQPEVGTGTVSSNPAGGATTVSTLPSNAGRLLANASDIPSNGSLNLNDPTYGAIILIHLDNGSYVAYSSVCTHAGCQVQFDPSMRDIACPCHGALFDPYNGAQVLRGPARTPLQNIPIQYDASTGNIYVTS
jgi:thiosulfate dehydrogenase [quinone] large subunit